MLYQGTRTRKLSLPGPKSGTWGTLILVLSAWDLCHPPASYRLSLRPIEHPCMRIHDQPLANIT